MAAPPPPMPTELGPLSADDPGSVGPFTVIGRLGAGGMGVVYGGLDTNGRCVAIKVIAARHAAEAEFRTRFAQEIALVRGLRATCAPAFLGAEEGGDEPWLATEFVPGRTLREHVAAFGPLRGAHLQAFAVGVAEGLSALHGAGVTHRDLKPGNVVLSPDGPKVLDFGIAHAGGDPTDDPNRGMGTPGWMAPERMAGRPADPANDVYCWGLLVAFAATGTHVFGDVPSTEVAARIRDGHPPDLSRLPSRISSLVGAALSVDPTERPTAESIGWVLLGERPSAAPPSSPASAAGDETTGTGRTEPTVELGGAPASPSALSTALVPLLRDLWVGIDAAGHDPHAWRTLAVASGGAAAVGVGAGAGPTVTKGATSAAKSATLAKGGAAVVTAGAVVAGGYFAIDAIRGTPTTDDTPAAANAPSPSSAPETPSPSEDQDEDPDGQEFAFRNLTMWVPEDWTETEDAYLIEDALVLDTHNPDCVEPPGDDPAAYAAAVSHCGHVVLYGPDRIHADEPDSIWTPLSENVEPANRTDVGFCVPGMEFLESGPQDGTALTEDLVPIGDRDAYYREWAGTCGPNPDIAIPELETGAYPYRYLLRSWYLPESEIFVVDEWQTPGIEEILADAAME
ncbi:serine/threonine protein kinase [Spiractinospora alimapuensis]|uniref:serine/threonine protein kinase n=1 Tax=Spiractinospora alimapuensis TaxID=2820884 RepID=UPI001F41FB15|nr:serine/threonine-protein kinase [Spiractinospora alimapuensis]QVQ50036.1 serine/threonine protein kinase [Spiractinospora alimapuensis]